ncbi:unnamed protein product [Ilex paraguariensis]|uniref:Uncharacterized protein n=1 Tax=Ilex paraguariensis TaxID=185542 RepID=A0ABC8UI16_9AQUA
MKIVTSGCDAPNFESDPSINLDQQSNAPTSLFLAQRRTVVRSNWNHIPINEGRPNVSILVTLINGLYADSISDLLAAISGVDGESVVVNSDIIIRVSRNDGDLDVGAEDVGCGDVQAVDGGVLEDKTGFFGLQNRPDN